MCCYGKPLAFTLRLHSKPYPYSNRAFDLDFSTKSSSIFADLDLQSSFYGLGLIAKLLVAKTLHQTVDSWPELHRLSGEWNRASVRY